MLVRIMNNFGVISKNDVNNVGVFSNSVFMNSIFKVMIHGLTMFCVNSVGSITPIKFPIVSLNL